MTNAEIIAMQRRNRELRASAETVAARLREWAGRGAMPESSRLLLEAAEVIDWLHERIARMNREALEEQRETNRALGEAHSEGRHEGLSESRGTW